MQAHWGAVVENEGKTRVLDRVGFGCGALSTLGTPRASRRLLEGVLELGIRHFDTAPLYGRGYSERLLGQFLRGKRESVSIATKFGLVPGYVPPLPVGLAMGLNALRRWGARARRVPASVASSPAPAPPPPSPPADRPSAPTIDRDAVKTAFDGSCRALGTDHIDLYLLHEHVPSALTSGAMDFLLDLKASGRVGQIGLAANGSRYAGLSHAELMPWDVLQYEYGPAWPDHASLPQRFPTKSHVFHSCLRGVTGGGQAPGRVLARCLRDNPSARVLFSSTRLDHVSENVRTLNALAPSDADL
ncbi:MAG: aldo/keto reductase [Pseudomonadota bacterium]